MVERIRALLEYRQLTPTQFADAIGVARPIVSHILSGRNKPSLEVVQRILAAMPDLAMPWLLNGTGEMLARSSAPVSSPAPAVPAPGAQAAALVARLPAAAFETPVTAAPIAPAVPPASTAVSSAPVASQNAPAAAPGAAGSNPPIAGQVAEKLIVTPAKFSASQRTASDSAGQTPASPTAPSRGTPLGAPHRAVPKRFTPPAKADLPPVAPEVNQEAIEPVPTPPAAVSAPAAAPVVPMAPPPPVVPVPAEEPAPIAAIAPMPAATGDAPTASLASALFAGTEKPIRRIVIFYRDGSFADYQPE